MHVCLLLLSVIVGICVFQGHCVSFCSGVLYLVWMLVLVSIYTHVCVSVLLLCTLHAHACVSVCLCVYIYESITVCMSVYVCTTLHVNACD